jgi:uncharacterized protein
MRASDFDILIVPRRGGANEGDWSSRWRAKLSTARFAGPADPHERSPEIWSEAIAAAARETVRPILFVGHGDGAAAIVHAAPSLTGADVRGAVLVAPPDPAALERLGGGWPVHRRRLPWPSLVVASQNDPEGAFVSVSALAADWGAELIDAGLAGQIDEASGHGPWPEGLMRLAGFLRKAGEKPQLH